MRTEPHRRLLQLALTRDKSSILVETRLRVPGGNIRYRIFHAHGRNFYIFLSDIFRNDLSFESLGRRHLLFPNIC
jgi:hypothetical protein